MNFIIKVSNGKTFSGVCQAPVLARWPDYQSTHSDSLLVSLDVKKLLQLSQASQGHELLCLLQFCTFQLWCFVFTIQTSLSLICQNNQWLLFWNKKRCCEPLCGARASLGPQLAASVWPPWPRSRSLTFTEAEARGCPGHGLACPGCLDIMSSLEIYKIRNKRKANKLCPLLYLITSLQISIGLSLILFILILVKCKLQIKAKKWCSFIAKSRKFLV